MSDDGADEVVYVMSTESALVASALPSNPNRVSILLHQFMCAIVELCPWSCQSIQPLSSDEVRIIWIPIMRGLYLQCWLQKKTWSRFIPPSTLVQSSTSVHLTPVDALWNTNISDEQKAEYGLDYDCPMFPLLKQYTQYIAGGSLMASNELINGAKIAMHWDGGRHHATSDCASGFCYVNDIVLSILHLQTHFKKILYVDLDIHHGDGVEKAFWSSARVLGVDFHYHASGFFPGTGRVEDVGIGRGKNHNLNICLKAGISGGKFVGIVTKILSSCMEKYIPDCVVIQCGCDGLFGDPKIPTNDAWNLSISSFGKIIKFMKAFEKPMLLLGGGGYNNVNAAKCWSYATMCALDYNIDLDIPEHEFWSEYGPSYDLMGEVGNRADLNTDIFLDSHFERCRQQIDKL